MARELSRKPHQVRTRLRRGHSSVDRDYNILVEEGALKPVEEWDLEELARGRPRDRNGNFAGNTSRSWMTSLVKEEIKRRLREGTLEALSKHVPAAVRVMAQIMKDPEADYGTRLKAASIVIEYAAGKPQSHVHVEARVAIQEMLAGALVLDDGSPAHPVIDGVWRDDEESDEDAI